MKKFLIFTLMFFSFIFANNTIPSVTAMKPLKESQYFIETAEFSEKKPNINALNQLYSFWKTNGEFYTYNDLEEQLTDQYNIVYILRDANKKIIGTVNLTFCEKYIHISNFVFLKSMQIPKNIIHTFLNTVIQKQTNATTFWYYPNNEEEINLFNSFGFKKDDDDIMRMYR